MFIRVGNQTFDPKKICGVSYVDTPTPTTTVILESGQLVFEGSDADVVWNWHIQTQTEVEL